MIFSKHRTSFRSIFFLFFIFSSFLLSPLKLSYNYLPDTKFKVETNIKGKHLVNGQLITDYTQYYKVVSSIISINEQNLYEIYDEGFYYINNTGLREINSTISTTYYRDTQGITFAPRNTPFPVMRNIPYLPNIELEPGTKWDFEGLEVQEFFKDRVISSFPVSVNYIYTGNNIENQNIAEINYTIKADVINRFDGSLDRRILAISGKSDNKLLFNIKTGLPEKEYYSRHYQLLLPNPAGGINLLYEFIDTGERIWTPIEKIPESVIESIKEQTKDIDDVTITQDERGIKISLEDIQFLPDSADLTHSESLRLNKIAEILEKYKDKNTMIIGHTTDRGTESGRQKLSVERAKSVADYLINKGSILNEKTQIMGKGGSEPIAPNTTSEGLRKNRRVEIYILEE